MAGNAEPPANYRSKIVYVFWLAARLLLLLKKIPKRPQTSKTPGFAGRAPRAADRPAPKSKVRVGSAKNGQSVR